MFGQEPRLPIDLALGTFPTPRFRSEEQLKEHLERLDALRKRALVRTRQAAADREPPAPHRSVALQKGDKVLMRQHIKGRCKISDRYSSTPATVTRVPSDSHGSFTVKLPDGGQFERHGSQLKKFYPPAKSPPSNSRPLLRPPVQPTVKRTTYRSFELVSGKLPVPVRQNAPAAFVARSPDAADPSPSHIPVRRSGTAPKRLGWK